MIFQAPHHFYWVKDALDEFPRSSFEKFSFVAEDQFQAPCVDLYRVLSKAMYMHFKQTVESENENIYSSFRLFVEANLWWSARIVVWRKKTMITLVWAQVLTDRQTHWPLRSDFQHTMQNDSTYFCRQECCTHTRENTGKFHELDRRVIGSFLCSHYLDESGQRHIAYWRRRTPHVLYLLVFNGFVKSGTFSRVCSVARQTAREKIQSTVSWSHFLVTIYICVERYDKPLGYIDLMYHSKNLNEDGRSSCLLRVLGFIFSFESFSDIRITVSNVLPKDDWHVF